MDGRQVIGSNISFVLIGTRKHGIFVNLKEQIFLDVHKFSYHQVLIVKMFTT